MVFSWTKQFLMSTGLFALIVAGHAVNLTVKERLAFEKNLEDVSRLVQVTTKTTGHLN